MGVNLEKVKTLGRGTAPAPTLFIWLCHQSALAQRLSGSPFVLSLSKDERGTLAIRVFPSALRQAQGERELWKFNKLEFTNTPW